MKLDTGVRYAESHEWARKEGDVVVVGISDHAQDELSDVVYVELPETGTHLAKGETFGVVESVKAASDVYMPIAGEIIAVNDLLTDKPELVNQSPFGDGWIMKFKPDDIDEWDNLLSAEEYERTITGA